MVTYMVSFCIQPWTIRTKTDTRVKRSAFSISQAFLGGKRMLSLLCQCVGLYCSYYLILKSEILLSIGTVKSDSSRNRDTLRHNVLSGYKMAFRKIDLCNLLHKLCFYQGRICLSQFLSTFLQGFPGQISNTHTKIQFNPLVHDGECLHPTLL